jgi:hypothetical protein
VRHLRFDIATLSVEQVPVVLKAAYLLVAEQQGAEELQWECLAYGVDDTAIPQGRYRVDLTTLEGRVLGGSAVLVRSVAGAHVLRGDGPLGGFDPDELDRTGRDRADPPG